MKVMLRSLEIQNFKGIKQGKIDDLAQVNILVGRNNSGKSTILDALVMLRSAVVGTDLLGRNGVEQIIRRRVDTGRGNLSYDELWFRMETGAPFSLTAELNTGQVIGESWQSRGQNNVPLGNVELSTSKERMRLQTWSSHGEQGNARIYQQATAWQDLKSRFDEGVATFLALIHIMEPGLIHQPFNEAFWYELAKDRNEKKVIGLSNDV
ncbi:MAG: AAA family ATPase, partial [Chloroflexi bacterium]|nr:AAA family ATPase [Chloroflexota bacterium]